MTGKTQERLLYLISPIGLIVLWQLLLMAGIGDRRFVPAPSAIRPALRVQYRAVAPGREPNYGAHWIARRREYG